MKKLIAAVSTAGLVTGVVGAEEIPGVQVTGVGTHASAVGPGAFFSGTVRIDAPFKGSDFLMDGGVTAAYCFGELAPAQ